MTAADLQRYALLLALGIMMFLLVDAWNTDYGRSSVDDGTLDAPLTSEEFAQGARTDTVPDESDRVPTEEAIPGSAITDVRSDVPDATLLQSDDTGPLSTATSYSDESALIEVVTPVLHVWIDLNGGDIVGVKLPQYPVSVEQQETPTTLLDRDYDRFYVAESGIVNRAGFSSRDQLPMYESRRSRWELEEGELDVILTTEQDGIHLEKRFTFRADDYLIDVVHSVSNDTDTDFTGNIYGQIVHDGLAQESPGFLGPRPFLGAAVTTPSDRYMKLSFDDIAEERFRETNNGGWIALLQHYFLSAWVVNDDASYVYFGDRLNNGRYRFGLTGPALLIPEGATGEFALRFYVGPKTLMRLEEIAENLNLTVDYGFLWWLSMPMFYGLYWLHQFVGNWGVAIILFTVVIKAILYPLSNMSLRAMARMRTLSPQMKRIQERFSGDRERLTKEMTALYRKEGFNPIHGCLPMLVQMPVFIALYWVLYESVELRQAPFILWIQDLSLMDPWYVLPLLMGASMYGMHLLNPPMPDPMQQRMMKILPVVFTILFAFFPAGLVLYWLVNNVLSFAQQWYVTRQIDKEAAAKKT